MPHCDHKECLREDVELYILHPEDNNIELFHYCPDHAQENGFCWLCGEFWGGVEEFEFDPSGLCPNCAYDARMEKHEDMDEGEFDDCADISGPWEDEF